MIPLYQVSQDFIKYDPKQTCIVQNDKDQN
jgi:hypothetical protein